MREGRPGDGGGEIPNLLRRGLNPGDNVDVDKPTDVIDETERVGDFSEGLIFEVDDYCMEYPSNYRKSEVMDRFVRWLAGMQE